MAETGLEVRSVVPEGRVVASATTEREAFPAEESDLRRQWTSALSLGPPSLPDPIASADLVYSGVHLKNITTISELFHYPFEFERCEAN